MIRIADPRHDAPTIRAIYHPLVVETAVSFEYETPTAATMEERIALTLRTHPWLVLAEGETVLGYAYATGFRARPAYAWAAETSVYVSADARGRGVGRRLMETLLLVLTEQGFVTAIAGITLPNPASVALHEHLGFAAVGAFPDCGFKRGAWWTVGFWTLALGPRTNAPVEPMPFARFSLTDRGRQLAPSRGVADPDGA